MEKTSRILVLSLGALLLISLVVPVSIAHPVTRSSEQAQQEPAPKPITINGTVSTVSETSLTVLDAKKVEQTITIDANTKITKGGKAATATDIKANDSVVVVAQKGEGTALTAVSIKVG
jgi:methionine-rich copper-binding protein CopC